MKFPTTPIISLALLVTANALEAKGAGLLPAPYTCHTLNPIATAAAEPVRRLTAFAGVLASTGLVLASLPVKALNLSDGDPTAAALENLTAFNTQLTADYGCFTPLD